VLVVEDDQATRAFLIDNLIADGFRAVGASGVGEGLRAIEVRQPSLVVLDLGLDDGSGLALLDRVRAADGLASRIDPDLPVIVLSGRTGDADRVRSFARGADDHLNRPLYSSDLRAWALPLSLLLCQGVDVGSAVVCSGVGGWRRCQMRRARWRLRQRIASRWVLPWAVLRVM